MTRPWLLGQAEDGSPQDAGAGSPPFGMLADAGDHLLDALLWITRQAAAEAFAIQSSVGSHPDTVTSAAIRLVDGTPVSLAVSGISPEPLFELNFFGEKGRIRATDQAWEITGLKGTPRRAVALPQQSETIDANFIAALTSGTPLCCPAQEALDTVRLLEAVTRSAATGQRVRLVAS
jgi:predicted dehydrogenase